MKTQITDAMREVLNTPELQRNLNGKVVALFKCLDEQDQKRLACSFAEHVLWICNERSGNDIRFGNAIDIVKEYLRGNATLEEVQIKRLQLYNADNEIIGIKDDPTIVTATSSACAPIKSLIHECCGQEFIDAKIWHKDNKSKRKLEIIAKDARYAVACHVAGIDWDSQELEIKKIARQKGQEASDEEAKWQITVIFGVAGIVEM